ncbi:hypothetical protein [Lentzea aerocolonigenes]|uniref:hypothetical protein n=1 Tax=Lentzea aerocolonigenes TaxID=68170 RepID=UPI0004C4055E|nr:hypothetical protein [Lentzea aerocolonigenes]MCP2249408.1 hypothetical protein [Lentzea aerocolonigenes]
MAPVRPNVQPSTENYPAQEHERMKNLTVENYDPNAATEVIDAWVKFGTKFRELAADFNKIVNDSQGGWSGAAAEGVRQALSKVGKFSDDTGHAFHATAQAIATQRDAAVQANRTMPEPVKFEPWKIAGKWGPAAVIVPGAMVGGAVEAYNTYNEKQEAKQYAVQVMQERDTTMMAAAQSMPVMDATPQVTHDQGTTQTSSTTSTSSLNNVGQYRPPANTGMPGIPPPNTGNGTTNPSWVAPQAKDPNLPGNLDPNRPGGNQNRPGLPGGPGAFPPGRIPPGGAGQGRPPGGGQGRVPGGGQGMRGGGPGGAGARGTGPGGMAGVGRNAGSFGPSNPGGSAGVMGSGPGGAGSAGRAGAAGAGGAGAGGAGAGKGGGEEDKEHKSNYLVPTDEFFDDDRMVAPPVIGG